MMNTQLFLCICINLPIFNVFKNRIMLHLISYDWLLPSSIFQNTYMAWNAVMFSKIYFCGVSTCVGAWGFTWRSKVNLHQSVLSFNHVCAKIGLRFSSLTALALSFNSFLLSVCWACCIVLTHLSAERHWVNSTPLINTAAINIHVEACVPFSAPILGSHLGKELLSDLLHF